MSAGPTEDYVWVYSLIQQGEQFEKTDREAEALAAYLDAQRQLTRIKQGNPGWNTRVVDYRLRQLNQRIASLQPQSTPSEEPVRAGSAAAVSGAASAASPQVQALNSEIQDLQRALDSLRSDNTVLQAKLKEALSVRPAAMDPREYEKAHEENQSLMAEIESLQGQLAAAQAQQAPAGEGSGVMAALQSSVEEQTQRADRLEAERDALTTRLAEVTSESEGVDLLRMENTLLKQQLDELRNTPQAPAAGVDQQRLNEVMTELALLQNETEILHLEKLALETRLTAVREQSASADVLQELADTRAQVAALETQRTNLQRQVAQAENDVANLSLSAVGEPRGDVQTRIQQLEARIAVYEADKVPLSTEEMALFRMSRATGSVRQGRPSPPPGLGTLVAKAETQFKQGDYAEAEVTLREMLEQDEGNVYTLANLGAMQVQQGKYVEAEGNLRRALEVAPNDPFSLMTMGLLQYQQGDNEEALDYLGLAAQANPDSAVVHNYLGVTLSQQGMRGPAETALRRAIQLQPDYGDAHFNLALVYALQDPPLPELARWHYQKALAAGHDRGTEIEHLLDRGPGE